MTRARAVLPCRAAAVDPDPGRFSASPAGPGRPAADGKTTKRGAPRNPLQLGATFWHFRHESRVTAPSITVQNIVLPPLSALAKILGVRPYYCRWDSQI
jgi:hypothetical protein